MHVFVTGGTGTIGTPVVAELLAHRHAVTVLARSDASARSAESAGADIVRGSLADLATLHEAAQRAEGVIHLAFGNDFSSPEALDADVAAESAALATLGEALIGTGKPIVTAAGTPALPGRASTEEDPVPPVGPVGGRSISVARLLGLKDRGVRGSAVRLPRTVHDRGRGGFAGLLTEVARRTGIAGYPGDGSQRWPAVHARDAAVLFRLALESAPAGTAWHAVADEGDRVLDIVTVIGRRLGLPVESLPAERFGPLGAIFTVDQPSSSTRTREALGWRPRHPSLLEDLELVRP